MARGLRIGYFDASGFKRLGCFTQKVNVQHTMLMGGALHLDMIRKGKATLECASGNATMQKGFCAIFFRLARGHIKRGIFDLGA